MLISIITINIKTINDYNKNNSINEKNNDKNDNKDDNQ